MAQPAWLKKYLTMKPEVNKIFDDLEEWHNHCRFEMIEFNPAHLYKSNDYKEWSRRKSNKFRKYPRFNKSNDRH